MLNLLKKVKENLKQKFSKINKIENKSDTININEIENFLNKTISDVQVNLDEEINKLYTNIQEEIRIAKENLDKLEKAELMNEKIDIKEKQIMEGNRQEYCKRMHKFLDNLNLTSRGYFGAKEFIVRFNADFQQLNKNILKSFIILQEFYAHESTAVAKNIKQIAIYTEEFQRLIQQSKMNPLINSRNIYTQIKQNNQKIDLIEQKIEERKEELSKLRISREEMEKKMELFKNQDDFKKYNVMLEEREELINRLKTKELNLLQEFSLLERALKKHQRNSIHEKLIEEYLVNAATTLQKDNELKILSIFEELKINIEKTELKDKQKDKTLEKINQLNKEYLLKWISEFKELKDEKSQKDHIINFNKTMRDYNELEYKSQHLIEKSGRIIEEINQLEIIKNSLKQEELQEKLTTELQKYDKINIIFKEEAQTEANKEIQQIEKNEQINKEITSKGNKNEKKEEDKNELNELISKTEIKETTSILQENKIQLPEREKVEK